jgi:hypothetical protein
MQPGTTALAEAAVAAGVPMCIGVHTSAHAPQLLPVFEARLAAGHDCLSALDHTMAAASGSSTASFGRPWPALNLPSTGVRPCSVIAFCVPVRASTLARQRVFVLLEHATGLALGIQWRMVSCNVVSHEYLHRRPMLASLATKGTAPWMWSTVSHPWLGLVQCSGQVPLTLRPHAPWTSPIGGGSELRMGTRCQRRQGGLLLVLLQCCRVLDCSLPRSATKSLAYLLCELRLLPPGPSASPCG